MERIDFVYGIEETATDSVVASPTAQTPDLAIAHGNVKYTHQSLPEKHTGVEATNLLNE